MVPDSQDAYENVGDAKWFAYCTLTMICCACLASLSSGRGVPPRWVGGGRYQTGVPSPTWSHGHAATLVQNGHAGGHQGLSSASLMPQFPETEAFVLDNLGRLPKGKIGGLFWRLGHCSPRGKRPAPHACSTWRVEPSQQDPTSSAHEPWCRLSYNDTSILSHLCPARMATSYSGSKADLHLDIVQHKSTASLTFEGCLQDLRCTLLIVVTLRILASLAEHLPDRRMQAKQAVKISEVRTKELSQYESDTHATKAGGDETATPEDGSSLFSEASPSEDDHMPLKAGASVNLVSCSEVAHQMSGAHQAYSGVDDETAHYADEAEAWLRRAAMKGILPQPKRGFGIIGACTRFGDTGPLESVLKKLEGDDQHPPDAFYHIVVRILLTTSKVKRAMSWVGKMLSRGVEPSAQTWTEIAKHGVQAGRVDIAEHCIYHMVDAKYAVADAILTTLGFYQVRRDYEKTRTLYQHLYIRAALPNNPIVFNEFMRIYASHNDAAGIADMLLEMRRNRVNVNMGIVDVIARAFSGPGVGAPVESYLLRALLGVPIKTKDIVKVQSQIKELCFARPQVGEWLLAYLDALSWRMWKHQKMSGEDLMSVWIIFAMHGEFDRFVKWFERDRAPDILWAIKCRMRSCEARSSTLREGRTPAKTHPAGQTRFALVVVFLSYRIPHRVIQSLSTLCPAVCARASKAIRHRFNTVFRMRCRLCPQRASTATSGRDLSM